MHPRGLGMNLDVYLAQIIPHEVTDPQLIRLVDEYHNLELPLSKDGLTSTIRTTLRIIRDTRCDTSYLQTQFRTGPGDSMAILPERLGYQPKFERTPSIGEMLLCDRTVRR